MDILYNIINSYIWNIRTYMWMVITELSAVSILECNAIFPILLLYKFTVVGKYIDEMMKKIEIFKHTRTSAHVAINTKSYV